MNDFSQNLAKNLELFLLSFREDIIKGLEVYLLIDE